MIFSRSLLIYPDVFVVSDVFRILSTVFLHSLSVEYPTLSGNVVPLLCVPEIALPNPTSPHVSNDFCFVFFLPKKTL